MTLLLIAMGYLAGSIPTGLLLARRIGIDPRQSGSGNIGATNVLRSAGPRLGLLTLAGDTLKGALPTWVAAQVAPGMEGPTGLAAVVGHVLPVWLGFHGGKGAATALGVLLALDLRAAGVGVAVFLATTVSTRFVSLGSILGSIVAAGMAYLTNRHDGPFVAAIAVLIIVRHVDNMRRLLAGTEPRFTRPDSGQRPESGQHRSG